eukprot:UN24763
MKIGEKCILRCRADYGYGERGSPPTIPGGASLDFEVELFSFSDPSWETIDDIGVNWKVLDKQNEGYSHPKEDGEVKFEFSVATDKGMKDVVYSSNDGHIEVLDDEDHFKPWPQFIHTCIKEAKENDTTLFETTSKTPFPPSEWKIDPGKNGGKYWFTIKLTFVQKCKTIMRNEYR